MTRVCFVGAEGVDVRFELLSRETSREALSTYELTEPFENALGLETVSLGAAVSLLNDLNWYIVRFADRAWVREPSVSETEWLSRDLAEAIRNDRVDPADSGEFLQVWGLERDAPEDRIGQSDDPVGASEDGAGGRAAVAASTREPGRLVEPLYARRTDGEVPEYDLRDVGETVVVRVTEAEFDA